MTLKPKSVSIIIPCYNGQATLERCLNSVIAQTYGDLEICFVDNNSSDGSVDTARAILGKTDRPSKILSAQDKGVSFARNTGISAASGRYICFLDCDDWLPPTSVARRVEHLAATDCGMVYGSYLRMHENGQQKKVTPPAQVTFTTLLKKNHVPNLTGMYDTLKSEKVMQAAIGHEDYDMWLNVISQTGSGQAVPKDILGYYQVSNKSLSANKLKAATWHYTILARNVSNPVTRLWYFINYVYYGICR